MSWKIPLFKMHTDQNDIDSIAEVIKRGSFWATGPEIKQFEEQLAHYMGSKYALSFNSGTSALHSLLIAEKVAKREVIVPSFTFISTANAVILANGKPVFAEIEPDTFGLNVEDVKRKITKNTAAIIIVHFAGFPARDTTEIKKVAEDAGLLFLEDVAESMGATIKQKKVGTFGQGSILSFCQNKVITTGEGGAIITDSAETYEKTKLIQSHGRVETKENYFNSIGDMDYIEIGYNYRMSSITAALGIAQLKKIDKLITLRRQLARKLDEFLSQFPDVTLPKKIPNHLSVNQMYPVLLKNTQIRDKFQKFLASKGIMTKVYFQPIHLKTVYQKMNNNQEHHLPITEDLANREVSLPFYPSMTEDELNFISATIHEFFTSKK